MFNHNTYDEMLRTADETVHTLESELAYAKKNPQYYDAISKRLVKKALKGARQASRALYEICENEITK